MRCIRRGVRVELAGSGRGDAWQRELAGAGAAFDRAEAEGEDEGRLIAGRWMTAMLAGDFEQAWRQSDRLRREGAADPHRFWQGEELRGRLVIVRCLHGFGDAVQMFRYAPRLREVAAEVVWEVPAALMEIAPYFAGVENVITWGVGAPAKPPAWEVQVEVTELPYLFRTQVGELPLATHYLRIPGEVAGGGGGRRRVGLGWTAGEWNPARNVPVEALRPLLSLPGLEFWNLQGGAARRELPLERECGDGILGLAKTVAGLDLVITVDTLAAHLAGALGRPCWVMLQDAADWRWMVGREDTPWYPTVRLFRQPVPGDWGAVIEDIRRALEERVA